MTDVILSAAALAALGLVAFVALALGFGLGWRARGRHLEAHRRSVQRLREEAYNETSDERYRKDWERENQ